MRVQIIRFLVAVIVGVTLTADAQSGFRKVLFLGNSITRHGPKADIDWSGNWGMAASAEAKDYVHLVVAGLRESSGREPEFMVNNIADFERAHDGYNISTKLKDAVDFQADLVVLAIGENVRALKTKEDQATFQKSVTRLLSTIKGDRQPTILVRTCFWGNAAKDEALRHACRSVDGILVDIGSLGKDEQNYARSERPFKHAGVANHPGDRGMAAIAAAILKSLGR